MSYVLQEQSTVDNNSPLDNLDEILANHPFGNSNYIIRQLHVCYKRRLGKISAYLPAAGQLLQTLDKLDADSQRQVISDTVVRCAIQHSMKQIETGEQYGLPLERCQQILQETIHFIRQGKYAPLGSGFSDRLGAESFHPWIWTEERDQDLFVEAFRCVLQDNYGDTQLCTLGKNEIAALARGARLLNDLLPFLGRSAVSHVSLIAVFCPVGDWNSRGSSSQFRMSGTFFLTRTHLENPWWVAEHLFHEALHQQHYDFRHGHSLLVPSYGEKEGPKVCSLWNLPNSERSNFWNTDRVLAAFHVYVHLALLSRIAADRAGKLTDTYGPDTAMIKSQDAIVRAHYLSEQLRLICWEELGLAGRCLVEWFTSVLEVLDSSPPPVGSSVHLLFDRYRREAGVVDRLQAKGETVPGLSQRLGDIAKDEITATRRTLILVGAEPALSRFDSDLTQFPSEEWGRRFGDIRRLIAKTVLEASPGGYGWARQSGAPDEMLRDVIDGSSEALMVLLPR